MVERPDQPRFDYFSRHFEQIDDQLEAFGRQFGWELIKNPLRKPERDLHKIGIMRVMLGIYLEGNWLELDVDAPFLHTAGVTAIYRPVPDLGFFRRIVLVEHETFDNIKANLDQILYRGMNAAETWVLPSKTEFAGGGCYTVPEGWCVASKESLKT